MYKLSSNFTLIMCVVVGANCQSAFRDVDIDQGPVRGYNIDDSQVFSFYGIPYATAPTGENRFKAPLAPPSWTNTFNASVMDINCPQGSLRVNVVDRRATTFDCLVVNLWVPSVQDKILPVYVYLHGGFFQYGNAYEMLPVELVKRGMIVVSVNYRLGVHGFLCLGTEYAPGNAGLKDQLAALRWVRRNIGNFGGNPDSVTLGGSSAGSVATELHMLSPASNSLFNKVITESGSALSWTLFEANHLEKAENFARQNGVATNHNIQLLEIFYRNLSDHEMNHPYTKNHRSFGFLPCIETNNLNGVETFLAEHPLIITKEGRFINRPNLSGFTSMEGLHYSQRFATDILSMGENFVDFMPPDLEYESATAGNAMANRVYEAYFRTGFNSSSTFEAFTEFYTDSMFAYYQYLSARMFASTAPVYFYFFSFNGSVFNAAKTQADAHLGPGHMAQSLYVYESRSPDIVYSSMTEPDFLTQERLRDMWYNFIAYGQPIPTRTANLNVDWVPFISDQGHYLDIGNQLTASQGFPLAERFSFWDTIYEWEFPIAISSSTKNLKTSQSVRFVFTVIFFIIFI